MNWLNGNRLLDAIRGWAFRQRKTKLGLRLELLNMPVQLNLNLLTMKTRIKRRQPWDGLLCHGKILGVEFNADSVVTDGISRRNGRTCSQERVENRAFTKRQERTNQNPHEMLRFEARMVSNCFLALRRASTRDGIGQGFVHR